ncbi:MAG: hypothetical protein OEY34_07155 [Cyclobacteriaceae bacterium]|nr:hypothetical protein [Cyclobacteriaceae bacterium]
MTKKDFFRIVIKLFGLYSSILTIFTIFPSVYSIIYAYEGFQLWDFMIYVTIPLFLSLLFLYALFFQPDFFISKLKLDQGFDDDDVKIDSNNPQSIIYFAIILIGGYFFVSNFSPFLLNTHFLFKNSIQDYSESYFFGEDLNDYTMKWVQSLINLSLGYLIVSNAQFISAKLAGKKEEGKD